MPAWSSAIHLIVQTDWTYFVFFWFVLVWNWFTGKVEIVWMPEIRVWEVDLCDIWELGVYLRRSQLKLGLRLRVAIGAIAFNANADNDNYENDESKNRQANRKGLFGAWRFHGVTSTAIISKSYLTQRTTITLKTA